MPSPLDRRTFLALLAAGTVSGAAWSGLADVVAPGADAMAATSTTTSARVDGVVRLGRSYLHDHPDEADATKLRSLLPGLDAAQPVRPQLPALAPASVGDFEAGGVVFVDGWHLAVTEARARRPRSRWGPDRVQLDARKVRKGSTMSADVCVIGAGAAGITVSRALAAKGHQVLLLESGGFTQDKATQSLYKGTSVGIPIDPTVDLGLDTPRLRFFGGTTNHWAGFCRPFPEGDLAARPWVPRSGWPITRADLDPYYAGAHDVIKLGPYDYSIASWTEQGHLTQPFLEDDAMPHVMYQVAGHPVLGDTYRDEIVASDRIRLVLWSNVTHLALDESGGAIDHVDIATLSGNSFHARAPQFVLATGGLEVPRVLLTSNDRRPAGIGNEHDQVGRSFMEHVNIAAGPVPLTVPESVLGPYKLNPITVDVNGEPRDISLQTVALIAPDIVEREGLRACEITLEYPFSPDDSRLAKIYPTVTRGIDLLRAQGKTVSTVATARILCEQEPNPASRVTITRATDPLGMPRIQLDWQLTRDDRLSMLTSLRTFGARVGQHDAGRFRLDIAGYHDSDPGDGDDVKFAVNTGSHHIGTARMSTDPADGVVDADCKVHSVANLYIGGSAVFPTSGANTPTLTIVALALRLADHLDAIT